MNREQKKNIIDDLSIKLRDSKNIYFTKIENLKIKKNIQIG